MRQNIDTVIFDMDGTVLDTLQDLADAVNVALRAFDMPERTIDEVRSFVGNGVKRLLELSVPGGFTNPRFEEVFAKFREYYGVHCNDKTKAYDGILPLLRELEKEGYALAIVSNKLDSAVKELNEIYFEGIVKVAIGEVEGIAKKPAPDMVEKALRELGKTKETAVYVGDSDVDLMTARNAGLPCISVLWGFREEAFLKEQGAQYFARTPAEIP
ncbi:MAG: HAD family hydrolase, partial [Lachnospira sp.]|nr:HAD family hydrolase [Lachnospira sp.]